LSFVPEEGRPVYCKSCLKKVRSGEIPRLESNEIKKEKSSEEKGMSLDEALSGEVQKFD